MSTPEQAVPRASKAEIADPHHHTTLMQLWEDVAPALMPDDAPQNQRSDLRRAFFAGVVCAFEQLDQCGDLDEAEAAGRIRAYQIEIAGFNAAVQRGLDLAARELNVAEDTSGRTRQ